MIYAEYISMLNRLLNIIFPPCCVNCGKLSNDWICKECREEVSKFYRPVIIKKAKYDLGYIYMYDGGIRNLMIKFKFFESPFVSHFYVSEILKSEKIIGKLLFYDIIIPVGMSKTKMKERGYNQTQVISRLLAYQINKTNNSKNKLKCYDILHKKEGIKQQAKLTKKERMQNVKNAYYINDCDKKLLENKNVILLDDIYTTGATINECVKVLKKCGVENVFVLVIAKDEI